MRIFKRKKDFEAGLRLEREVEAATMLPNTRFGTGAAAFLVLAFVISIFPLALPRWKAVAQHKKTVENDPLDKARPYTQMLLTRLTGSNNAQVVTGQDKWLFYQMGVAHVTGPGFLDAGVIRQAKHQRRYADPRTTILNLRGQLKERGIELMLLPVPDKATIYPEKLWPGYDSNWGIPQNVSFEAFKADMKAAGIPLYDPTDLLMSAKVKATEPLYLATDTHWTPHCIEICSEGLAAFIKSTFKLPIKPPRDFRTSPSQTDAPGDLVRLLGLPKDQKIYSFPELPVQVVLKPEGGLYLPEISADVLLMGDSYAGTYEPGGAGLGAQLAYRLRRSIDTVTKPNGGSWGARYLLRDKLQGTNGEKREDHLTGKKLLIWEFAARDLSSGDWMPCEFPKPATP